MLSLTPTASGDSINLPWRNLSHVPRMGWGLWAAGPSISEGGICRTPSSGSRREMEPWPGKGWWDPYHELFLRAAGWLRGCQRWVGSVQTAGRARSCSNSQIRARARGGSGEWLRPPTNPERDVFTIWSLLISMENLDSPNPGSQHSQACLPKCDRKEMGLHSLGCWGRSL